MVDQLPGVHGRIDSASERNISCGLSPDEVRDVSAFLNVLELCDYLSSLIVSTISAYPSIFRSAAHCYPFPRNMSNMTFPNKKSSSSLSLFFSRKPEVFSMARCFVFYNFECAPLRMFSTFSL